MTTIRPSGFVLLILLGLGSHLTAADPLRIAASDDGLGINLTAFAAEFARLANHPATAVDGGPADLDQGRVDLFLAAPADYVAIRDVAGATPLAQLQRSGRHALVVVLADSPYRSVLDLRGMRVAFGRLRSTSGHLAPMQILADLGLDPLAGVIAVHRSTARGWAELDQEEVAAIGLGDRAFNVLRGPHGERYRVLGRGGDLPGDVLLAGHHLHPQTLEMLRTVVATRAASLAGATGVPGCRLATRVPDSAFDRVRAMYQTIGYADLDR